VGPLVGACHCDWGACGRTGRRWARWAGVCMARVASGHASISCFTRGGLLSGQHRAHPNPPGLPTATSSLSAPTRLWASNLRQLPSLPARLTAHCSAGVRRGACCWRDASVPRTKSGKAAAGALVCGRGWRAAARRHGPTGGTLHLWELSGLIVSEYVCLPPTFAPRTFSRKLFVVSGRTHAGDQAAGTSHGPSGVSQACCPARPGLRWFQERAKHTPSLLNRFRSSYMDVSSQYTAVLTYMVP